MKIVHNELFDLKTKLWKMKYNDVKTVNWSPWKMTNLQKTVKGLKNISLETPQD